MTKLKEYSSLTELAAFKSEKAAPKRMVGQQAHNVQEGLNLIEANQRECITDDAALQPG